MDELDVWSEEEQVQHYDKPYIRGKNKGSW